MNREKKEYNIFNTGLKNGNNDDNIIHKIIEYNSPSFIKIRDFIKMKNREERIKYEIKNNFNSRSMSLPSYNQNNKKITLKMFLDTNNNNNSFENIKNNNESLTSSQNIQKKYMDKFNQLKIYQKSIEKDIENTKKNELKRIWNEFTENNYGKKYNTDIKMVISALVGENNMIKEIEKQKCISNELKKIRRICSFYDPYENHHTNSDFEFVIGQKHTQNKVAVGGHFLDFYLFGYKIFSYKKREVNLMSNYSTSSVVIS